MKNKIHALLGHLNSLKGVVLFFIFLFLVYTAILILVPLFTYGVPGFIVFVLIGVLSVGSYLTGIYDGWEDSEKLEDELTKEINDKYNKELAEYYEPKGYKKLYEDLLYKYNMQHE